ncbi:MAG: hypothetical protein EOO73_22180 [Myxococcales bacterium]|nr:MAG: hypothetical protein EOO73_22180 [Myxococcales bacterium]
MTTHVAFRLCAPVCALFFGAVGCGPRHDGGGGEGGDAGSGGVAGEGVAGSGGIAGTGAVGGGGVAGAGAVGSGGVAGSGAAGSGGVAGEGGAAEVPGYDEVIGCPPVSWPETATFTILGSMQDRFFPSALSGDGRVAAGQYDGGYARWTEAQGFTPAGQVFPDVLSCTGQFAVGPGSPYGVFRQSDAYGEEYLFGTEGVPVRQLSVSPDGSAVIGNLDDSYVNPGPFPVRWRAGVGADLLSPLANSLVYHTNSDGTSLLGVDILHVFRWQDSAPKTVLLPQAPLAFDGPPIMPVSADGHVYAFTSRSTLDTFIVARDDVATLVYCPGTCAPTDVSGTGKVVLLWGDGPHIWTAEHGFLDLATLLQQFGADTQGRRLSVHNVSNDGQAFLGLAADPNNPLDYQGFYATLPRAAYEVPAPAIAE